ncbi:MAG: amidohydrolase family protein [Proteobacteria bacterium]|nr:amidohydrolase family protein [Pseudomonadota bacterium]
MTASTLPHPSLLIRNAHVLTLDDVGHEWPRADIVIEGGRIAAIGPDAGRDWPRPFGRVIDAEGQLAMPGLINAHFHSPGNLMKGMLPGYPLEIFMLHEVPPLAPSGDANRVAYVRTMLGALEMLRRGITAVHDDAYHVPVASTGSIDAIMQAYQDAGIRATVAIDQPNIVEYDKYPYLAEILPESDRRAMDAAPRQSGDELIALYRYLIERWHGAADGRLAAAVSCSAPQRVTVDYFQALSALSKQHDLPFNIHILETKLQRVLGQEKFGKSLVRYVHDLGLLDERMMVIHAIWIDDEDIALLARSGCTVAHNPVCNLRLGSGVMPYRALRDAGVPICMGTDEMNTDDSVNLWFVAKTAALLHTLATPDYDRWPQPGEILHAATRGGARALRRAGDLGQLAAGCAADIALLDLDTVSFTPLNDLSRQLVHCEDGGSVRTTIVDGRVVFEDGRITTVDERALRAELRELMKDYRKQAAAAAQDAQRLETPYRQMYERACAQDVGMNRWLPSTSGRPIA